MYAIVDIETTGGSFKKEKITEIAIYLHDGEKLVDEFVSLINPEKMIPEFITKLTGISNEMVADKPRFYEIAKQVVEITNDAVFVAHNVSFDYNFVKHEFKELGFDFNRKQLCTVKLSRKLMPGFKSYSLGNLCKQLNIPINGRHRAAGDAFATVKLFEMLQTLDKNRNHIITNQTVQTTISAEEKILAKNLPGKTGVYYFYNKSGDLIYVGKSTNIQKRTLSHFQNTKSVRSIEMKEAIADISYELTGSELIALLLESSEIKKHKPRYNRAQRRTSYPYGIFTTKNTDGYHCLKIDRISKNSEPLTCFSTKLSVRSFVEKLVEKYSLCHKLSGLYENSGACFHHSIGQCAGACIGKENVDEYNSRFEKMLEELSFDKDSFFIIDKGRHDEEFSVVKVEHGKYCGFGYSERNLFSETLEHLHDSVKYFEDNRDIRQILQTYLRHKKVDKLVYF